ncbi:MAG: hypothetical protein K2L49_05810 [Muribaculaceae bacterium]|nr:hypothetical protein [Muribaculaceae bacterium]
MKSTKKSLIIFGILSLIAFFAFAKQEKVIQIFRNGEIIQEYAVDDIDYIEVNDFIPVPDDVNASVANNQITITWAPIAGATYNIYRSNNNEEYSLLATNIKEASYIDTNPLRGPNYYRIKAIINNTESSFSQSVAADILDGALENGIYLGISAFNKAISTFPLSKLSDETIADYYSFIDGLEMQNGTILYYSIDNALASLSSINQVDNLSNIAIVTFTDGLDQGSMMLNDSYLTDEDYLTALNNTISNTEIQGIKLSAYSIGVRGSDVSDISKFRQNLQLLASSSDNAFEVSDMSEVNSKFQQIANELTKTSFTQTLALTMPGVSNGTIIRFTFDNIISAEKSQLYIEGSFNLKERKLENVTYHGLSSSSGTSVQGAVVDGIMVKFIFEEIVTDSGEIIQPNSINQWTYIDSSSTWQINSEFEREDDIDVIVSQKSAIILLVLDSSSSLGSDFPALKSATKTFVSTICMATPKIETPDISYEYSKEPFDLALAVSKGNQRYYLTPYDYNRAGGVPDGYSVLGLTIVAGSEKFYIRLNDHTYGLISHKSSEYTIGTEAPSKEIAEIIVDRYEDINNGMKLYGGIGLSGDYWTNSSDYNSNVYRYYYYYFNSTGVYSVLGTDVPDGYYYKKVRSCVMIK